MVEILAFAPDAIIGLGLGDDTLFCDSRALTFRVVVVVDTHCMCALVVKDAAVFSGAFLSSSGRDRFTGVSSHCSKNTLTHYSHKRLCILPSQYQHRLGFCS